jgi:hypothetical protein
VLLGHALGCVGLSLDQCHDIHPASHQGQDDARETAPVPWEKSKKKAEAPKVSAEEARKRFERLMGI